MEISQILHQQVLAVCPIVGVAIADPSDKSTWRIHFTPDAAPDQQVAAQSVLVSFDYASTVATQASSAQALAALAESDRTMGRIQEAVSLGLTTWTTADVVAWVNYRRDLRQIMSTKSGSLPKKPEYPAGT